MAGDEDGDGLGRRTLLGVTAASAGLSALPPGAAQAQAPTPPPAAMPTMPVLLRVNGREHRLAFDPRVTLLDALRERLDLTGSKKGCDQGQCGACTVLLDGRRVLSCLTLALSAEGQAVTTIEGLAAEGAEAALHPMQQAFIEHDAFQCGYCTPGQIMLAIGCIEEGHADSAAEIREFMSGNLCRCAAYPNIQRRVPRHGPADAGAADPSREPAVGSGGAGAPRRRAAGGGEPHHRPGDHRHRRRPAHGVHHQRVHPAGVLDPGRGPLRRGAAPQRLGHRLRRHFSAPEGSGGAVAGRAPAIPSLVPAGGLPGRVLEWRPSGP